MHELARNPLEALLRLIAAAAPNSWYPGRFASESNFPLSRLNYLLEHLWLDGLLEKGENSAESGATFDSRASASSVPNARPPMVASAVRVSVKTMPS